MNVNRCGSLSCPHTIGSELPGGFPLILQDIQTNSQHVNACNPFRTIKFYLIQSLGSWLLACMPHPCNLMLVWTSNILLSFWEISTQTFSYMDEVGLSSIIAVVGCLHGLLNLIGPMPCECAQVKVQLRERWVIRCGASGS